MTRSDSSLKPLFGWAAGLAALILLPFVINTYIILLTTEVMIMGIFALSFNLLFGYTGLLSFGHAAFFGMGGYVTAYLLSHACPSLTLAFLTGVAGASLTAIVVGYLSVKLDEIYFAILTLGFGMMFFSLAHQWRSVTGGSDGLTGLVVPRLGWGAFSVDISSPWHYYYLVVAAFLLTVWILRRITQSNFGLILVSIRENKERAAFTGINIRAYRLASFSIAGFFAGVAGGLFAVFDRMASPSMLHWTTSAQPVLMTVLGGAHTFFGPVVGSILFFFIEHIITKFTDIWMIYLGAILIPLVIFFPEGVLGTLLGLKKRKHG